MAFLAITARILSIWALACLAWASALSKSAWDIIFFSRNSRARSRLRRARSALAMAERSWACSTDESSSTSRSPARTVAPDSNAMFLTAPDISAPSTTPWTAATEPTAVKVGCQVSCFASVVVTVSGGGTKLAPCANIVLNCNPLIPASVPTKINTMTRVKIIFLAIGVPCGTGP